MPVKFLVSINFLVNSMYLFEGEELSKEAKVECFQLMDSMIDRIREAKFKEKIEPRIKNARISFQFLPKGKSLGSSCLSIKLGFLKICYLTSFAVKNEVHIQGVSHKFFQKHEFDVLVSHLTPTPNTKLTMKDFFANAFKFSGRIVFLTEQVSRVFEYILSVNDLLQEQDHESAVILIPRIYSYYLDVIKRLSEYMPSEISQNLTIGEDDLFLLRYVKFDDGKSKPYEQKVVVMVCSATDFVKGEVFKDNNNFKDFQVVFENKQAESIFNSEVVRKGSQEIENGKKESHSASVVHNKMLGNSSSYLSKDKETPVEFSVDTSAKITEKSDMKSENKVDYFEQDTKEVYFVFKNHDVFFHFLNKRNNRSHYGAILTDEELSVMEYMDPIRETDDEKNEVKRELEQDFAKTKDFFEDYLRFTELKSKQSNEFKLKRVTPYNWEASTVDQFIVFSMIKAREVVFLNSRESSDLKGLFSYSKAINKKVKLHPLASRYQLQIVQNTLTVNFNTIDLPDLKFKSISNDLKVAKVTFQLSKEKGSMFDLKIKKSEESKTFSLMKGSKLIKMREFFLKNGVTTKLEIKRLNFDNRIYVINNGDTFTIEGLFSDDYFKIRELIYNFANL